MYSNETVRIIFTIKNNQFIKQFVTLGAIRQQPFGSSVCMACPSATLEGFVTPVNFMSITLSQFICMPLNYSFDLPDYYQVHEILNTKCQTK
jgi:hypothetical protein